MDKTRKEILNEIIADRGIIGTMFVFILGPLLSIVVLFGWCLEMIGTLLMQAKHMIIGKKYKHK